MNSQAERCQRVEGAPPPDRCPRCKRDRAEFYRLNIFATECLKEIALAAEICRELRVCLVLFNVDAL